MEKAMPELRGICVEANQKIREVLNNPDFEGDKVVWAGLVMDSLLQENNLSSVEDGGEGGLIQ